MKKNEIFNRIKRQSPKYVSRFVSVSDSLAERIEELREAKGMSKGELAQKIGLKNQSQITKFLTGQHNFTIMTVTKLEEVLEGKLLYTHKEYCVRPVETRVYVMRSAIGYNEPAKFQFPFDSQTTNISSSKKYQIQS